MSHPSIALGRQGKHSFFELGGSWLASGGIALVSVSREFQLLQGMGLVDMALRQKFCTNFAIGRPERVSLV